MSKQTAQEGASALKTPTDIGDKDVATITAALNRIVADTFVLYIKTKNFHWHMNGPHFRDYHLLLDEQADQIFATIDPLAERVRKLGQPTIRSIAQIAKLATIKDDDRPFVPPLEMLDSLADDNKAVTARMRETHALCDDAKDIGTAALLEVYIDESERRTWFLFEASRAGDGSGH